MPICVLLCDFLVSSFNTMSQHRHMALEMLLCVLPGVIAPGGSFASQWSGNQENLTFFPPGLFWPIYHPLGLDSVHFPWVKGEVFLVLFNVLCPSCLYGPLPFSFLANPLSWSWLYFSGLLKKLYCTKCCPYTSWANPWFKNSGASQSRFSAPPVRLGRGLKLKMFRSSSIM